MTVDLLITNATIVNADSTIEGHIAVRDGRIAAIYGAGTSPGLLPDAARSLDAGGRTVIPGGVDSHVHVEQMTGAYKSLDTYETASVAALWGGTTTIMDFGIPADSSETPLEAAENKMRLARVSRCDVALHGAVIDWDDTVPAQLERLAEHGIRSVKMYTTNRGSTMANGDTIVKVMREMARLDGLTYIHAEHDSIIVDCLAQQGLKQDAVEQHGTRGAVPLEHLHHTRPELAEATSVAEVLAMAEYTGSAVYFVHQTIPEAVALVQNARSRGLEAYSETCPHYLTLDEDVYASEFPEKYACCPPIRSREAVEALLERVRAGEVHTISSDHSCYNLEQKRSRSDDVRFMPHGLPGIETRMPVAFTTLVIEQGMPVQQFVELFATGPARINRLTGKGIIAPGYDADLVIFDPDERRVVDGRALHMGTDFSPFDGMELAGWPSTVVMGGRVVLHEDRFSDPGPTGRFLQCRDANNKAALDGKAL
ncbi:amidohydrolase family protein [Paenarthrobacter sp. Z7-10]|uniref:dihydroorotase n=1 Tax=Paenarthrobacter sp. Z7-10 TaxID=2787635 RepID=UPI0022A9BE38|nr:amidohydrolase family protein [Paenarthrobacter sp. Z7-10]MCZ2403686.1 amidohydrolase family protein [Paenarthrobacter sp. Z7-10]